MRRRTGLKAGLAGLLLAVGLGGAPTVHAATPHIEAVRGALEQDALLDATAYRMALANRALCARHAPLAGFAVSGPFQYAPRFRAAFARLTGIGAGLGVVRVQPGSPAAIAGLSPGDPVIAIAGEPIDPPKGTAATIVPLRSFAARFDRAAREAGGGAVTLSVERAGNRVEVRFVPETGCDIDWQVVGGKPWHAATDGRMISVWSGFIAAMEGEDELAFIVGHELAHAIFGEPRDGQPLGPAAETRADIVGLHLAARAGYDPAAAARLIARYGERIERSHPSASHPPAANRAAVLRDTAARIAAMQAENRVLWPAQYPMPDALEVAALAGEE